MASGQMTGVLRQVEAAFGAGAVGGMTDAQLLERFRARRGDDGSETAFTALVVRHGPSVLAVCRSLLRDPHEAEDAFQATFLVLARRAGSVWVRDSLAGWLSSVAYRVAARARAVRARRRTRETPLGDRDLASKASGDDFEGRALLHEELARLPEAYRLPIVLCHLEGRTHDEAAQALGVPVGTVRSRLARGRDRLRDRLVQRGLAPGAAVGALMMGEKAPAELVESTVRAATSAGSVSAAARALAEGVVRTMWLNKSGWVAGIVVAVGLTAGGVGVAAGGGMGLGPNASPPTSPDPGGEPDGQAADSTLQKGDSAPASAGVRTDPTTSPPGHSPRMLEARLKAARGKYQMAMALHRSGTASALDPLGAQAEYNLLVAEIQDQADTIQEQLELLEVRLEAKQAECDEAETRDRLARMELDNSVKLRATNSISQGEFRQTEARPELTRAAIRMKQAERHEVEVRIDQLKRRLKRLGGLNIEPLPEK
jgi:RNA polymerase sigma factor (sigma-70 family)